MNIDKYQEYRLDCSQESPNCATERWVRSGRGNGQEAYTAERLRWPRAEIKINVREVVLTTSNWRTVEPDEPCTGSGFSHKAHGQCQGYATDRT